MNPSAPQPLWAPSAHRLDTASLTRFMDWLRLHRQLDFASYEALWRWSVDDLNGFWLAVWDYFAVGVRGDLALGRSEMPGARWFPGAALNYVDQVLRHATPDRPAIVATDEAEGRTELSYDELSRQVAALAATLRAQGVGPGARVAAYLPNIAETVVSFLAVASIGAVWSVCSPDMGEAAVADRFRQIEPLVLIATDSYRWAGQRHDRRAVVAALLQRLPTVKAMILVRGEEGAPPPDDGHDRPVIPWARAIVGSAPLICEQLPFDHPLWIVYSSGTTGLPKAIVHGHGGIVLEQLKFMSLHGDLGPDDRYLWYSSTGWIMWNLQVAGLLVGATICIYDGAPTWPDPAVLWRLAGELRLTMFGGGAAYFLAGMKSGLAPKAIADLSALRAVGSTGSPLSPEGYRWIFESVGEDIFLACSSGGTDIASAFVGGVPILPLYEGEMQAACLGARVEAWDESGASIVDEVGELVCATPMPSMPLRFWNDPDGSRYRESYFDLFPGAWRHGDWLRITPRGGAVIYGRSDATINRQGVRMGAGEIYRIVEAFPEVEDSLVVDLEYLGHESFMPLFLVLASGVELTPELEDRIRAKIRAALTARHAPSVILAAPGVPRTLTGKKMEVPVKKLLLGMAAGEVASRDGMVDPTALDWYAAYARHLNTAKPR